MVSPGLCIIVKNFPIASPKIGQVHGENNHNTAFHPPSGADSDPVGKGSSWIPPRRPVLWLIKPVNTSGRSFRTTSGFNAIYPVGLVDDRPTVPARALAQGSQPTHQTENSRTGVKVPTGLKAAT